MKRFLLTALVFISVSSLCKGDIWYISEGGRGNKDGTSWSNAASDFPDLLQNPSVNQNTVWSSQGQILPKPEDTIFVSAGRYSPIIIWCPDDPFNINNPNSNKRVSFEGRIHIYGGFCGNETSLEERMYWYDKESIIDGDSTYKCIWIENQYKGTDQYKKEIVIDGFTLENGYGQGAAIRIVNNTPLLSNLKIQDNVGYPILYFENCQEDILDRYNSNLILCNSIIAHNQVLYTNESLKYSDAVFGFVKSKVDLLNITVSDNDCEPDCFILEVGDTSSVNVVNSILYNNIFSKLDMIMHPYDEINYYNSNLEISGGSKNWSNLLYGNDMGNNIDEDPLFVPLNNYNYEYDLMPNSPCVDAGSYALYDTLLFGLGIVVNTFKNTDYLARPRYNQKEIDMGACEIKPVDYAPANNTDNNHHNQNINLYNSNDEIIINNLKEGSIISIKDIVGRTIYFANCNSSDLIINQLTLGMYFIVIQYDNKIIYTDKIVLNK